MRAFGVVALTVLLTSGAYAQSVKERLRQAREHEAELLKPKPKEGVPKEEAPKEDTAVKEKKPQCQEDPEELDGVLYYSECFCKQIKYPQVEAVLKGHGLLYQPQGVKEMGDGVTHLKPEDRVNYRYTCGVALTWDPTNTLKFPDVKKCYAFVDKIVREIKDRADVNAETLNYGCGEHVQKSVK